MREIKITPKQQKWLDDRGGRKISDVYMEADGMLYTLMGNGAGGDMKVYIPSDIKIDKDNEEHNNRCS